MSRIFLLSLFGALVVSGLAFAWRPDIDLTVAGLFHNSSGFSAGREPVLIVLRQLGWWIPYVLLGGAALAYVLRRASLTSWGPSGRAVLFLASSLALGPGLLVNVALKDHSHRPRPIQVVQFGGADAFVPWDRFDGACETNCSFASGEASAAFWTVAPALLTPSPIRIAAVAAALAFGAAVAVLRLAFGGHFLSDVVLSAELTLAVVVLCFEAFGLGPARTPRRGGAANSRQLAEKQ